jgi:hypothetical protein
MGELQWKIHPKTIQHYWIMIRQSTEGNLLKEQGRQPQQ